MAKDILLDDTDDLLFQDGDLVIGESADQDVSLIIRSCQGDWRASPFTGFGIAQRMRNEINRTEFERELGAQLALDGFSLPVVQLGPDGLTINAKRNG